MKKNLILLKGGCGFDLFHLSQTAKQLTERFGKPSRKITAFATNRSYWLFPRYGFECIISTKSNRVLSLFFHRTGNGYLAAPVRTSRGIAPGDWAENITKEYGPPDKFREGRKLSTGEYVRSWTSYFQGVGFYCGLDSKVDVIGIFARKRKSGRSVAGRK